MFENCELSTLDFQLNRRRIGMQRYTILNMALLPIYLVCVHFALDVNVNCFFTRAVKWIFPPKGKVFLVFVKEILNRGRKLTLRITISKSTRD